MSNDIDFDLLNKDSCAQLVPLFSKVSGTQFSSEYIKWSFNAWSEDSFALVARKANQIVASYTICPKIFFLDGKPISAGTAIQAVVDPDFNNCVSIFDVSIRAYKIAKERGIDFLITFPNSNYRSVQTKIERVRQVRCFNAYISEEKGIVSERNHGFIEGQFKDLEGVDFSQITHGFQYNYESLVKRIEKHPLNKYDILFLSEKKREFVITKQYEDLLHVIYYHIPHSNTQIYSRLESLAVEKKMTLCIWPKIFNSEEERLLKHMGFRSNGFEYFVGCKFLGGRALSEQEIRNLTVSMIDSDVF